MLSLAVVPVDMRPVKATSLGVYGDGGAKKSGVLIAFPNGVDNEMRPEVARGGTLVFRFELVALATGESVLLNLSASLMVDVWKFVPETDTGVPGLPILGVNPVIVGPPEAPTVNGWLLDVEPAGVITLIGPVVAPTGTAVTISVADADCIVALTPLNSTLSFVAVTLNPLP
jgi:hypothetical protein